MNKGNLMALVKEALARHGENIQAAIDDLARQAEQSPELMAAFAAYGHEIVIALHESKNSTIQ